MDDILSLMIRNNSIDLETKCWKCNYKNIDLECTLCNGTGLIPTDNGRTLLEFIEKYKEK